MRSELKLTKLFPVLDDELIDGICAVVPEPEDALVIRKTSFNSDAMRARMARQMGAKTAEGERAVIQYVSTRDLDRDGEILDPKGAMLDEFRKAPVVLWGHDYSSPPVGSDEWIKVDDEGYGILSKSIYATTPRADEVLTLRQENHLRTSSVGFVPLEYVEPNGPGWAETTKKLARRWAVDAAEHFKDVKRIHTKWLLLEHSDVSVPSNINALQLAVSKGLDISPEMLRDLGVPDEEKETYKCECIKCGAKATSEKHCKDLKCEKCGGQMRRADRPGPGQDAPKQEEAGPKRLVIIPARRAVIVPEPQEKKILRIVREVVDTKRGRV